MKLNAQLLSIEAREQHRLATDQALAGKYIGWLEIFFTESMTSLFFLFSECPVLL